MSNQSNKSYLSEMLQALEANIEYLRQEGSSKLLIKNGQLLENVADIFIYEFTLDFFQEIEPGIGPIRVTTAYGLSASLGVTKLGKNPKAGRREKKQNRKKKYCANLKRR